MNSQTTEQAPSRRLPWYATSPKDSRVPPWYVWCGFLALVGGLAKLTVGESWGWVAFGLAMFVFGVLAWRR